jgi:predicted outer membrane repeat protein
MLNRFRLAAVFGWLLAISLCVLFQLYPAQTARAQTPVITVGNGTPASCNEGALRNAIVGRVSVSVNFNCGPNPVTINLTQPIETAYRCNITIDGGGKVTLSGRGLNRILILQYEGTMTVKNIILRDGFFRSFSNQPDGGAAIRTYGRVKLFVYDSQFINNTFIATTKGNDFWAAYGGAIWVLEGDATVERSRFTGNYSEKSGGAAIHTIETNLIVRDSYFDGNRSTGEGNGGAIYNDYTKDANGYVIVTGSTFVNNQSDREGGAINTRLLEDTNQYGVYDRNVFINNKAYRDPNNDRGDGGALRVGGSAIQISNSHFEGNTAEGKGGAIWLGDDIVRANLVNLSIINNSVSHPDGNTYGGGIFLYAIRGNSYFNLGNITLSGNSAQYNGGGIYLDNPFPIRIANSTIMENYAGREGGGLGDGGPNVILQNNVIAHNRAGIAGNKSHNCNHHNLTNGGNNLQWSDFNNNASELCSPGIRRDAEPKIGPVANNGGIPRTRQPTWNSPVIGAGNNAVCFDGLLNGLDARLYPRKNTGCDIGALDLILFKPTVSISVAPAAITNFQETKITYTLANPNNIHMTNVTFSHSLPAGLKLAGPIFSNMCQNGTITGNAGESTFNVTNLVLNPYMTCQLVFRVVVNSAGTYNLQSGAISATEVGMGSPSNSVSLNVKPLAPVLNLTVNPTPVLLNVNTTLSFKIENKNPNNLSGLNFSQPLPADLEIASASSNACGGTLTAPLGGRQISVANGTLGANQTCTFNIQLKGKALGRYQLRPVAVSTTQGGTSVPGTPVWVEVIAPLMAINPQPSNGIIQVGAAKPGTTVSTTLVLRNNGHPATTLNLSAFALPNPPFNVTGLPASLSGGQQANVIISCTPGATGAISSTFTLTTNNMNVGDTRFSYQVMCYGGYVVTKNDDDGSPETLSYVLSNQAVNPGDAVVFELTGDNKITFSNPLTLTVKPDVVIDAGCGSNAPAIELDGNGQDSDGLQLSGGNFLRGLYVHGFGQRQIAMDSRSNYMYCTKIRQ